MEEEQYIGKIAKDEQERKLGTIVKIENITGKTIKKATPHVFIRVRKFMKDDVLVPVELEKIVTIKEDAVIFAMGKEAFEKEVAKIRVEKEQRELYNGKSPITYGAQPRLSSYAGKRPDIKTRKK